MPFIMLALTGFFIGGVWSFARASRYYLAGALGVAALLSFVAAVVWWLPE